MVLLLISLQHIITIEKIVGISDTQSGCNESTSNELKIVEFILLLQKLIIGLTRGFIRGKTLATTDDLNGKANTSHNHSASNITSGTLSVARGGTGVTSITALKSALGISSSSSIRLEYGTTSGESGIVSFSKSFASAPGVVVSGQRASDSYGDLPIIVNISNVTTTGFSFSCFGVANYGSSAMVIPGYKRSSTFYWVAIA